MTPRQPTSGPASALCDLVELMAADMFPFTGSHQTNEGTRELRSIAARDLLTDLAGADAEQVTFKDLAAGDEVYWDNLLRMVDTATTVRKRVRVTFVPAGPTAARPTVELATAPITRLIRPCDCGRPHVQTEGQGPLRLKVTRVHKASRRGSRRTG